MFNSVPTEKKYLPEDIREAYSVVLYCCANAEGNIGDEEIIFIDTLFQTMSIFKDMMALIIYKLLKKYIKILARMNLLKEA